MNVALAKGTLSPLRLDILRHLKEPDSAAGLSRKLSVPRQKLNYHLRELERAGFLELVEERRKGNCAERMLRTRATSYLVDPRAFEELSPDPEQVPDRFSSAYLVALYAKAMGDLVTLRERAERAGKKLPTLSLSARVRFASAARQAAFKKEIERAVTRIVAKYHDDETPQGRTFELTLGAYPAVKKKEVDA